MSAQIIRFPINRVVRNRLICNRLICCGSPPELQEIDLYLRSVIRAREALLRQYRSLLMQLRAAAKRRTYELAEDGDDLVGQ